MLLPSSLIPFAVGRIIPAASPATSCLMGTWDRGTVPDVYQEEKEQQNSGHSEHWSGLCPGTLARLPHVWTPGAWRLRGQTVTQKTTGWFSVIGFALPSEVTIPPCVPWPAACLPCPSDGSLVYDNVALVHPFPHCLHWQTG